MKIVVWNCHQKLEKKLDALLSLKVDIAIIPECANPENTLKLEKALSNCRISQMIWRGRNRNKGLGIFLINTHSFQNNLIECHEDQLSIKCGIEGPNPINLVAIWTQPAGYVEKAHWALDTYKKHFSTGNTIFAGDFNSNTKWDKKHRPNHTQLIERLGNEFNMVSVYHYFFNQLHGSETLKTLFYRYNPDENKAYHIDYIFIPKKWLPHIKDVSIGSFKEWGKLSDHCPLILDLDI